MPAPPKIVELVNRFEQHSDEYHAAYNESQCRPEFINPLFKALGWDMDNEAGASEANKPVIQLAGHSRHGP